MAYLRTIQQLAEEVLGRQESRKRNVKGYLKRKMWYIE